RQLRADGEGFLKHFTCASGVSFLKQDAANVRPTVWILRIRFRDFLEGCSGRFQITLQEEADAVIVPARPVFLGRVSLWRGRGSGSGENAKSLGVLGNDGDGKVGNNLEVAGDLRSVAVEHPFAVVIVRRGRGGGCACIRRSTWFALRGVFRFDARTGDMRIEPRKLAVVQLGQERDYVSHIFCNMNTEVRSVGRS